MPASYPNSVKSFTTKNTNDTVQGAHVNDLQSEVSAVETDLLAGLPLTRGGTGLTALGAADTVLYSNGTTAEWRNVVSAPDTETAIVAQMMLG